MSRMSESSSVATAPAPMLAPTPANYDPEAPRHRGHAGVVAYCASKGITVTVRYLRDEVSRGNLIPHRIAQRLFFSDKEIDSWIASKRGYETAHDHEGHAERFRNGASAVGGAK